MAETQDMNMLCYRWRKKRGKYPPVVFIRQREQEVSPVSSVSLGETMCELGRRDETELNM